MKPLIQCVTLHGGRVGLSIDTPRQIMADQGRANVIGIAPATPEQCEWVRQMGGNVPTGGRLKGHKS